MSRSLSPPAPLLPAALRVLAAGVCLLLAACGGGDGGGDATPTPPPVTETAVPVATPRWPEVARAVVTTDDLNVRSGPGATYPVVGRLQPDDDVPVSGRLEGSEWLALPAIGWVVYDPEWTRLSVDFGALPAITEPETAFDFVGPVYPADGYSGIPVVDQVVAAIVSRDRTLLLSLASAPPPPAASGTPAPAATPFPTLVPDVTEAPPPPTATPTPAPLDCSDEPLPGDRLGDYLDALYRTAIPSAARGGDGQGVLRLYGVVRGPVSQDGAADYVLVVAFEGGEGRQLWISPDGRLIRFVLPCRPTLPGNLLRVTQGEPFFWFRPAVQPPVRPLP